MKIKERTTEPKTTFFYNILMKLKKFNVEHLNLHKFIVWANFFVDIEPTIYSNEKSQFGLMCPTICF